MRNTIRTLAIGLAGALVGALVTLAIPAPGGPPTEKPGTEHPIEKVRPRSLLVWTPVAIPAGFAARVATVPGVRNVAELRSGVAWLDGWTAGEDERRPPDGYRIPVEIAALDPSSYASFVPPAHAAAIAELDRGGIVLGDGGSIQRGIHGKGSLRFGERMIEVTGVVDDSLIGAHEGVVSYATGELLGITRARYLIAEIGRSESLEEVERAITAIVPRGVRVRIRAPGETPEFRHGDAVLPPVRLKEIFGEFAGVPISGDQIRVDPAWVEANISSTKIAGLGAVRCHAKVIPQMRAAFAELVRRGLHDVIDPRDFGGCFVPRFISRDVGAGISHHSWGIAFDVNVSQNPVGREPRMDPRVVEVLERWGFAWGGHWLVPDPMQFEFLRFPLSPKS